MKIEISDVLFEIIAQLENTKMMLKGDFGFTKEEILNYQGRMDACFNMLFTLKRKYKKEE